MAITTHAVGEEGGFSVASEEPTTLVAGEEEPEPTTMGLGEEDEPTTLAAGEEDDPKTQSGSVVDPFGGF
ncbi:MAG TPA: hypothetical protein VHG08_07435 [Longimicrobium sp.]|nr:hypothetical protein [Longimicrobium sp.]